MNALDPGALAIGTARPRAWRAGVAAAFARLSLTRLDLVMLAGVGLLTLAELALVLVHLHGHFSYSLDDPYIHLALADRIASGHYGLNPGEAAAPSSSILFPFLLAGLSFTGIGQYAPLLVCFGSTLASGLLLSSILQESVAVERLPTAGLAALTVSLLLGLNLIGLEFTGLEHSLHVALTLGCLLGTIRFLQTGRVAPWWWLCAAAQPLIRYEGASLWFATVCLLVYHRRFWPAAGLLIAGAVPIGLFSLFLHRQGLPLLPNSVLVKSHVAAAGSQLSVAAMLDGLRHTVMGNLPTYGGLHVLVLGGLLAWIPVAARRVASERRRIAVELALVALFVSLAHLVLGRFALIARYEIYVVAFDAGVLLYAFGSLIDRWLAPASAARLAVAALVPFACCSVYAFMSVAAFAGCRNIYDQQYQMHRFEADFYRRPVGVNDLGWVAYGSPAYVLDFWGLGSEEARLRRGDASVEWMDRLARRHDVGLAMIYKSWFDHVPESWRAVARLRFDAPRLTAGDSTVTFYATRRDARPAIEAALAAFGPTLPPGTSLERLDPS